MLMLTADRYFRNKLKEKTHKQFPEEALMKQIIIVFILLLFINAFVISLYRDISPSMDDTLLEGDVFIVLNFWYGFRLPFMKQPLIKGFDPLPNDILIFKAPVAEDEVHVKRCIAVGGQTVEIVEKKLFIDDVEIPLPPKGKHADPVIIPAGPYGSGKRDFRPKEVVPDSAIYVMGDNRDFSFDSRIWGFLPKENIRGKAWIIIWSSDPYISWSDLKHKIRWNRFFKRVE